MKITSKGQVTIPLPIRDEFGLKPGTDVEFVAKAGTVILRARRQRQSPVDEWLKEATGVARGKTTTFKIMKLTRGPTFTSALMQNGNV
jgi:AbrB family looped-hinge helix DNA binding protein